MKYIYNNVYEVPVWSIYTLYKILFVGKPTRLLSTTCLHDKYNSSTFLSLYENTSYKDYSLLTCKDMFKHKKNMFCHRRTCLAKHRPV